MARLNRLIKSFEVAVAGVGHLQLLRGDEVQLVLPAAFAELVQTVGKRPQGGFLDGRRANCLGFDPFEPPAAERWSPDRIDAGVDFDQVVELLQVQVELSQHLKLERPDDVGTPGRLADQRGGPCKAGWYGQG